MPHLIIFEPGESQRRLLNEKIVKLGHEGWALTGKYEAEKFGTWENLFENVLAPGLFVQREQIVVESADIFGAFPEKFVSTLEGNNADCMLILVYNSDIKHVKNIKSQVEIIEQDKQVPPWKKSEWLLDIAKAQKIKLSRGAADLLAESIESQEELRSELNKLALYSEGREIKISDVQNLSFDEGGRAQLNFLDGICENNHADVINSLKYLRGTPLAILLTAVCNRLRPALMSALFENKNEALKAAGISPAKKYAVQKAEHALKNYGSEKIKRFMLGVIRLSYLEKTNNSEGWPGFELLLMNLVKA